jgi:bifunctional pyridoxal-dependent enzyme with beta-cystathionase and maltose regulon repressor activities
MDSGSALETFLWPDSIRMNLALPFSLLQEAMERLDRHAFGKG